MPPSDSNESPSRAEDMAFDDVDAVKDAEARNARTHSNSSSSVEISELETSDETTNASASEAETVDESEEPEFRPFNRDPKYPHEAKLYFGTLGALLLGAHLGHISVWWVFAVPIAVLLPGEINKLWTYGIEAYFNALHFERPTVRDIGLIIGGLALIVLFLTALGAGVLTADTLLTESGESMIVGEDGSAPEGGHLLTNAVMNWWIYGVGVLIMFLVVGPAEELMFRHNLQNFMKRQFPTTKAIVSTNLVFALLHLPVIAFVPNAFLMFLPLFGIFMLGTVFSLQYERTDNLFVPSFTHSIWNSFVLTLLLFGV